MGDGPTATSLRDRGIIDPPDDLIDIEAHPEFEDVDPAILEWARRAEAREAATLEMFEDRDTADRGLGAVGLKFLARRLADAADSKDDLEATLRKQLGSHGVTSATDAEILCRTALEVYAGNPPEGDSARKWVEETTEMLVAEFSKRRPTVSLEERRARLQRRRQRVREIATERERKLQDDLQRTIREQQRQARIKELANATGLAPTFISVFLTAFGRLSYPKLTGEDFAGEIDPRGILGIQLTAPIVSSADFLKDLVPVLGEAIAIREAVTGETLLTGQRLSWWERVLTAALALFPYARRGLSRASRQSLRVGRSLARVGVTKVADAARTLAGVAVRARLSPREMLHFIGGLARVPARRVRRVLARIRRARRRGALELSEEEAGALERIRESFQQLRARTPGPKTGATGRRFTADQLARMRKHGAHVRRYFNRRVAAKLRPDPETIDELARLFRVTRRTVRKVATRAAAGEFVVLEKLLRNPRTRSVRLLKPAGHKGARTADMEVVLDTGETIHVEVRTVTGAGTADVGVRPGGGTRTDPAADTGRGKPAARTPRPHYRPSDTRQALAEKIKRGQSNKDNPGIIVVNLPHGPRGDTPLLRARQVDDLMEAIADKSWIKGLYVVSPTSTGKAITRVGARDPGLGMETTVLLGK